MNILILGLGSPVPSFIYNRLKILDEKGINLYLLAYKIESQKFKDFKNVKILIQDPNVFEAICRLLFYPFISFRLFLVGPKIKILKKIKWILKQIPLVAIKKIDIIHLQWVMMGSNYSWLKHFHNAPLVGSARGSQVTIYPFVNDSSYNELIKSFKFLDYIHCVSEDIKKTCLSHGCQESKLIVIYNGLNNYEFNFNPNVKIKNKYVSGFSLKLISIGSLIWRKGYIYQLMILKEILKFCNVELFIVGEGEDRNSIIYTAHTMGLLSNVKLLGKLSSDDIVTHLQNSDIYLSTSIAEGLANSVMEAASCGLPIVAFNCEGMDEIVETNKNGYIIPFGDLNEFVLKVKDLIQDDDLRLQMSEYSARKMKNEFDINIHNQELIKFYQSIILLNGKA